MPLPCGAVLHEVVDFLQEFADLVFADPGSDLESSEVWPEILEPLSRSLDLPARFFEFFGH
jgi:hypothetical protein